MKSLTIFLISIVVLTCLVKSSVTEGETGNQKVQSTGPSNKSTKSGTQTRNSTPVLNKNSQSHSDTDRLVCGEGQYLGNLASNLSCRSLHYTKCKEMVKRDKNAPITKTASERISSLSTDSVIRKRQLRKWRLKRRVKRALLAKAKLNKKNSGKIPARVKRQMRMRKAAEKFLNNMLNRKNKSLTKKNVDKIAKRLGKNKIPSVANQKQKVKKLLNSAEAKRIKSQKKQDRRAIAKIINSNPLSHTESHKEENLHNGNFCVHSVVWNINYCCYFNHRIEAQEFANSQPKEELFQQLLAQGRQAEKKDKEKRSRKKATNIRRVLRKIDSKNKAKRLAASKRRSRNNKKRSTKRSNKKSKPSFRLRSA